MHKRDKKMTKKVLFWAYNSKFPFLPPYSSSIPLPAIIAKLKKLTILSLSHKALHMLDSLYDQRIDFTLLLTGYYPVVFVGLTCIGAAISLL